MPTPQIYYSLYEEHEALRALAFKLLMSDEVASLDGPNASALFDLVGDFTDQGASEAPQAIATLGEEIDS